jgi:hypothetical protein
VTSIGREAFQHCDGLTGIIIPNSVTSIGNYAFASCSVLNSISIPSSVTSIGEGAFSGCTSLTAITVEESNSTYSSDVYGVLFDIKKNTLIYYPLGKHGNYIIPSSVTSIGDRALENCAYLTGITIPNSVTSIGNYAFQSCYCLTTLTIGSGVTNIGDGAFAACVVLTSISIPNGVTNIGISAFSNCELLTSITIPNSETSIGSFAFGNCRALTDVTIPERFIGSIPSLGLMDIGATSALINGIANNLANNDVFITALANKILAKSGNYGLSVKSELETLATKSELTSAITESKTAGVNSVLSNPNLWTLYTTSQIQNMAMGDLVLTKQVNGKFALNYDIEQSEDLKTWTTYRALYLPLNGLPTDKAFVRIKMINSSSNPSVSTAAGSNMY